MTNRSTAFWVRFPGDPNQYSASSRRSGLTRYVQGTSRAKPSRGIRLFVRPTIQLADAITLATLPPMSIAELQKLPALEKLKIIETLWSDLSADDSFKSPDWHAGELAATEAGFKSGQVRKEDWDIAKKELRAKFE
jgi:hypothetical protein